jgi:hypothetical protein
MLNFQEWLQQQEHARPYTGGFMRTATKYNIGDWLYFGIHDLSRYVDEHRSLPKWEVGNILEKMRPVVDVDPHGAPDGGELIWIKSDKSPSQMRYMKLAGKNGATVKKQKDGTMLIGVPTEWVEDVTSVFGTRGQLSGQKLGLVYDRGTRHQSALIRMIRAAKEGKLDPEQSGPAPVDQGNVDALKAQWGLSPGKSSLDMTPVSSPSNDVWSKLGLPPTEPEPTQRPLGGAMERLRAKRAGEKTWQDMFSQQQQPPAPIPMNPYRQTASYDPSVSHYDPYWKNHNDTKRYDYIIG